MSLTITNKSKSNCSKYQFNIYEHSLKMSELDDYILDILYEKDKLNNLFQRKEQLTQRARIIQLQRFIETDFCDLEEKIDDIKIKKHIIKNKNETYYSFFAEALQARLNIDFINHKLVTAVLCVNDDLTRSKTGADVVMYSEDYLILGESKFYKKISDGVSSIINDTTFSSKLADFVKKIKSNENEIILKTINGNITTKTASEIKSMKTIFTGFILHNKNKSNKYRIYENINNINIKDFPSHYEIHLYHLPIESKNELIFKAQRKALDLIIKERSSISDLNSENG